MEFKGVLEDEVVVAEGAMGEEEERREWRERACSRSLCDRLASALSWSNCSS